MITVNTIAEYKQILPRLCRPIGLVPTMGSLHEGHMSLVKAANKNNQAVVVSVFVNPTQFSPNEDFDRYPRDIKRDRTLLEKAGVDILFAPIATEMYTPDYDTWVEVGTITKYQEGLARPGHFRGVATIVLKLFNIIAPNTAYFGQKDIQQALVIKKMVRDLNLDLNIITMPTVRTNDGLALSSRNKYLTAEQKFSALAIYESLKLAEKLYAEGVKSALEIKKQMEECLIRADIKIDYISIATPHDLKEIDAVTQGALVSVAVYLGSTRLIDNTTLG